MTTKRPHLVKGESTTTRKPRRSGKFRRVIFIPNDDTGENFMAVDAETHLRIAVAAAVETTVESDVLTYTALPQTSGLG